MNEINKPHFKKIIYHRCLADKNPTFLDFWLLLWYCWCYSCWHKQRHERKQAFGLMSVLCWKNTCWESMTVGKPPPKSVGRLLIFCLLFLELEGCGLRTLPEQISRPLLGKVMTVYTQTTPCWLGTWRRVRLSVERRGYVCEIMSLYLFKSNSDDSVASSTNHCWRPCCLKVCLFRAHYSRFCLALTTTFIFSSLPQNKTQWSLSDFLCVCKILKKSETCLPSSIGPHDKVEGLCNGCCRRLRPMKPSGQVWGFILPWQTQWPQRIDSLLLVINLSFFHLINN